MWKWWSEEIAERVWDKMKYQNLTKKINQYLEAGFPILYLSTFEEKNALEIFRDSAKLLRRKRLIEWSLSLGYSVYNLQDKEYEIPYEQRPFAEVMSVSDIEDFENSLFIIRDVSAILEDSLAIAWLKELAIRFCSDINSNIVMISPIVKLPREIESFITVLEMDYPDATGIEEVITAFRNEWDLEIKDDFLENLIMNLKGLTETEIISILNLAFADDGALDESDLPLILEQKQQKIKKSGIMEMIPLKEKMSDIGGLENLKDWLQNKSTVMKNLEKAKTFGVDVPKGVLIVGVPGCGKSLTAKAAADLFQVPLLRLDMGRLMGKYVGESEGNLRKAITLAEAISPCVLWVDELEKAFAGIGGDGGGAEVTTRLFGNFLTWMQEKKAPVFVVATANNVMKLPPELLRKGRFDEIFYVGLPEYNEREQIFKIHIERRRGKDELTKIDIPKLVNTTKGYCGADIESVVSSGVENAFVDGRDSLTTEDIMSAIKVTNSLSEIMKDALQQMQTTYEKNKFKNASRK